MEPVAFSDTDVEQLAGTRAKPVDAVRRLRKLVPTEPIGKLRTRSGQPVQISRKDLPTMRRGRKRPERIVALLSPSEIPSEASGDQSQTSGAIPARKPDTEKSAN